MIRLLWKYRGFILGNVKREFQLKYRKSLLGAAWTIINPLAMITIYTIIFSEVMRSKLPGNLSNFSYSIYLCAGLLTWGLFTDVIVRSQNIFLDNANLIKKITFPHMILVIVILFNAIINFSIIFCIFLVFLYINGLWPGWVSLAILPVLIIQLLLATGLGIGLGVLNVFFRDVGHIFGIFMQFWFWLTPIVYAINTLPKTIQILMLCNPMYSVVMAYQGIFVNSHLPNWIELIYPLILGASLCFWGLHLFRNHIGELVDEL